MSVPQSTGATRGEGHGPVHGTGATSCQDRVLTSFASALAVLGMAVLAAGASELSGFAVGAVAFLAVGPLAYGGFECTVKGLFRFVSLFGGDSAAMAAFASEEAVLANTSQPTRTMISTPSLARVGAALLRLAFSIGTPPPTPANDDASDVSEDSEASSAASTTPAKSAKTANAVDASMTPGTRRPERNDKTPAPAAEKQAPATVAKPARAVDTGASANAGSDVEPTAWDLIVKWIGALPTVADTLRFGGKAVCWTPWAVRELPVALTRLWRWLASPRWKPFPWSWFPDPFAFVVGVLGILFTAPILAIEIIVTVPTMELLKAEWHQARMAWLRTSLPELVRSFSRPLGRLVLRDPRNHSYLPWMLLTSTLTPLLFFLAMRRHSQYGLEFSTLCIYHLLRVGPRFQLFSHVHTLVHKEGHCHKGFFKGPMRVFNCFNEWWTGPFYGVVPWSYYISHMKIHHRWHNDVDDVHTNLDLDRANPLSFFLYLPRFTLYWTGVSPCALFIKRREWLAMAKLVNGMVVYYSVMVLLFCWSPTFCIVYFVFPHVEGCVLLCAISYLWHAFVEEKDPDNQYVNSVTILDGHDNVWNEDYHVVHHHAPSTHWTDAPAHFEAHRDNYAACTATIFRNTEEGKLLQWLFEQNWDAMAEHFVDLNGKLSKEEKRALIVRRLSVVVGAGGRGGKRREWGSSEGIRVFTE